MLGIFKSVFLKLAFSYLLGVLSGVSANIIHERIRKKKKELYLNISTDTTSNTITLEGIVPANKNSIKTIGNLNSEIFAEHT